MWKEILLNWKTSAGGAALIFTALGDILTYGSKGALTPNLQADVGMLFAGLTALLAKDGGVTGTAG